MTLVRYAEAESLMNTPGTLTAHVSFSEWKPTYAWPEVNAEGHVLLKLRGQNQGVTHAFLDFGPYDDAETLIRVEVLLEALQKAKKSVHPGVRLFPNRPAEDATAHGS